ARGRTAIRPPARNPRPVLASYSYGGCRLFRRRGQLEARPGDADVCGQHVVVVRKDARLREWFRRLQRGSGASIARVAVMRQPAPIIWHMLRAGRAYAECRALADAGAKERVQRNGG